MKRPEWLKLRTHSIGGSDTGKIAGFTPSRFGLYLEKIGDAPSFEPNEQMWWGTELERSITARLIETHELQECSHQLMVRNSGCDWMTATLDAVDSFGRVWEYKSCGIQTAKKLDNGNPATLPESWILQAHHQMMCADVATIEFAVFVGHRLQLYRFSVAYDQAIAEGLWQLESEFWKHVQDRTPPTEFDAADAALLLKHYRAIDDDIIVTDSDEIRALAVDYERASVRAKFQADLADQCKAALLARMTTACAMRCGPYLLRRSTVDVKAQEPKPRAAYSYTKFTFTNTESDES
jgi:putative phage-type endonuclease